VPPLPLLLRPAAAAAAASWAVAERDWSLRLRLIGWGFSPSLSLQGVKRGTEHSG
jgi:hypothetical protein